MEINAKKIIFVLLAAAFIVGGPLYWRSRPASEAREQMIAELQTFAQFDEHRALLMQALDVAHNDAASRHTSRHGGRRFRLHTIDNDAYRAEIYAALAAALHNAGHEDAANALVEHQMAVKR